MSVLVLGDPMFDVWEDLVSTRQNPEALHTKVVIAGTYKTVPGGALNVARNIARLRGHTLFLPTVRLIPEDFQQLEDLCELSKVGIIARSMMGMHHENRGCRKHRVRIDGELVFRVDDDPTVSPSFDPSFFSQVLTSYKPDAIVAVDYNKGWLTPDITRTIFAYAVDHPHVLVVVDAKPALHAAVIKIPITPIKLIVRANFDEVSAITEVKDHNAVLEWRAMFPQPPMICVMTLGCHGAVAVDRNGYTRWATPKHGVGPAFMCGAGDVFTARMTHELLEGRVKDCLQLAVNAATEAVYSGQRMTLLG